LGLREGCSCTAIDSRPGNFKCMRLTVLSFRSLPIWNSTFAILAKRVCCHGGSSFHCRFHRWSFLWTSRYGESYL